MAYLEVKDLRVTFDDFTLTDINLKLDKGKFLALLGPSGAGKTTLIQAISGLLEIEKGNIIVNDIDITRLPVHKRKIGFVFQDFALFPHLNVYDNVAFGLSTQNKTKRSIRERVYYLLDLVGLRGYEKRNVISLSGGEKQRIALARTLAPEPDIILFDEPLSAVDEELRVRLREQLAFIRQKLNITAIYVTHDREEAFYFADLIGVIFAGKIWQIDEPQQIYEKPVTPEVARFLGIENRLKGEVKSNQKEGYMVRFTEHDIFIPVQKELHQGEVLDLLIRPEKTELSTRQKNVNSFPVNIISSKNYGSKSEYIVNLSDTKIKIFQAEHRLLPVSDEPVFLTLKPDDILIYKDNVLIN